ncbi:MAG: hypothetical protein DRZ80_02550 [Thermoprotei archaeon]|nr:MAG: hypothetical protein DRZ80_02550 [Thermoprotei archaeon]
MEEIKSKDEIPTPGFLDRIRLYVKISEVSEVARRYFVMNAFDGAMTMLGVVIGSFSVGIKDPRLILSVSISASLAMGVSGFVGAFITERAERVRRVKELERAMLTNLNGSIIYKASLFATFLSAVVDGGSPALVSLVSSIPFILAIFGFIDMLSSYIGSIVIVLTILMLLGVYLGKISRENSLKYGVIMLISGIIVSLFSSIIGKI